MNWLFATGLAITSRAAYSLGTKILSKEVNVTPQTQTFLLSFTSGVLAFLFSPVIGGVNFSSIDKHFVIILFIVLTSVVGNIIYFTGQKYLDTGTTQIAFSSILIWGITLSILFLKSKFSPLQVAGAALLMFAIALTQFKKGGLILNSGVALVIISAFLFSFFQVASASVSPFISTGTYLIVVFFGSSLAIFLIYMRGIITDFRKLYVHLGSTINIILFTSGTSLLYNIFAYLAYKTAPSRGTVVVLLTSQVVLSVIFGIIFLKEKDNVAKKIVAGVLAFAAGILIKS